MGSTAHELKGMGASLGQLADGVGRLVAGHLRLARAELAEDAKATSLDLARLLVFSPLILVGYVLVCLGAAQALARVVPEFAALLLVGVANVIGGGFGMAWMARRLRTRQWLAQSADELQASAVVLSREAPPALEARDDGH